MAHEFDGKKYEKASDHQKEWGANLIAELKLKGSERVLDLGCGDGMLTAQLAQLLPDGEVIGIDASRGMIAAARERERVNLHFLLKDIDDLDCVEEFDLIFSNAALHWVRDHHRLLRNVRNALREGGIIRFNFAAQGNCSRFFNVVREAISLDRFHPSFDDFDWPWFMPSLDAYRSILAGSGLQKVRVWTENADRFFPDVATMARWIDQPSLVPFLKFVPEADRNAFRDFVVTRMVEETKLEDGRCFETFRRINVVAQR